MFSKKKKKLRPGTGCPPWPIFREAADIIITKAAAVKVAASLTTQRVPVLSQVHGTFHYLPRRWHESAVPLPSPPLSPCASEPAACQNQVRAAIAPLIGYTLLPFNQGAVPQRSPQIKFSLSLALGIKKGPGHGRRRDECFG